MLKAAAPAGIALQGLRDAIWCRTLCCRCARSATGANAGSRRTAGRSSRRCRRGSRGHFGPELRRFVLMQYHQGQIDAAASDGACCTRWACRSPSAQVQRLLTEKQDGFLAEARDVLRAGLETSPWVSVDDTGARHAGKNGFCTQIGNDWFTWFGTRSSKSRLNFLDLLRAGHTDYVLNDAAYGYMRSRGLAAPLIARLGRSRRRASPIRRPGRRISTGLASTALDASRQDPVRIATEGALWGSVQAHDFLCDAVVLSDDAGQFNIGRHALCWVHAERLVHKLDTFTDQHRAAQQRVRGLIWDFYADLKAYRANPEQTPSPGVARAVRPHLPPPHRLRHAGSPAGAAACQQGRVADGAGAAGDPAPHQWLGERHPLPGHAPEGQRRNTQRSSAAIAAMPSWASPRPATSSASRSGIIWAAGSASRASRSFRLCRTSSDAAASPPDTRPCPGFCPCYWETATWDTDGTVDGGSAPVLTGRPTSPVATAPSRAAPAHQCWEFRRHGDHRGPQGRKTYRLSRNQPLDGHSAPRGSPPMDYRHKPTRGGVNFGRRWGVNIQRRLTA